MTTLLKYVAATLFAVSMMASSVMAHENPAGPMPVAFEEQDAYIREVIREHIGYDPLLEIIFACETTGTTTRIQHWNEDGSLLKNPTSSASGYAMVLLQYHGDWIAQEGRDMHEIVEYTLFLETLFAAQGYGAWNESRSCWGPYYQQYAQN